MKENADYVMNGFSFTYDEIFRLLAALDTERSNGVQDVPVEDVMLRIGEVAKSLLNTQRAFVDNFVNNDLKSTLLDNVDVKEKALNSGLSNIQR